MANTENELRFLDRNPFGDGGDIIAGVGQAFFSPVASLRHSLVIAPCLTEKLSAVNLNKKASSTSSLTAASQVSKYDAAMT